MDYFKRLENKIRRDFPDISDEELAARMQLIKHLVAINHQKNQNLRINEKTDVR